MSTFRVVLVERLGAPDPAWPSIYGPADPGSDPIAANGLHTLDLTPCLQPLDKFTSQLERDLSTASFSGLDLDLVDADGSLADAIGPFSTTLATSTRYYGPWLQVWEDWSGPTSAMRFLGYVDETSIQWAEQDAETKLSAKHATDLLRERLLTDFPELLRPYPMVPTTATQSFAATTADDALQAAISSYMPRSSKLAIESALWTIGQLSWYASVEATRDCIIVHTTPRCVTERDPVPSAPAFSILIGANSYLVDHIEWDTSISADESYGPVSPADGDSYGTLTYAPARIVLQDAPDLSGVLSIGTTVSWGIVESQRTHYVLAASVPAPVSGSDGQRWLQLNTVEQLVPGDVLTATFLDSTSGAPRLTTSDLPTIIDLDGETGKAWLSSPLQQALSASTVQKLRRNSQDPMLFDGSAYALAICAPFALNTSYLTPSTTQAPVVCWRPYETAAPALYGGHFLQTLDGAGTLQLSRRGADNGTGAYTVAGIWQGNWDSGWIWASLPTPSATHDVYGDALQWPGAASPFKPPVIYTAADLSGGATIPKNGWRNPWRTWEGLADQIQDIESYWDGSAIQWGGHAASGYIAANLVAFSATSASPGRFIRTTAPAYTYEALTADATLGSPATITPSGSLPSGYWLSLGMGVYAAPTLGHQEALLALVAASGTGPWSAMTACLISIGSSGALAVQQSPALSAGAAVGPWAIGGGLAVNTWNETRGGASYPRTRLHLVDGRAMPLTSDLLTLEVIPQSIRPLQLTGTGSARAIGGWYALALETYEDSNFAPARRLRFLWLDASMQIKNGDMEADPADPTNIAANFLRGEVISEVVPDGALIATMVRTAQTSDTMAGQIGGRLFSVDRTMPHTVERLAVGGAALSGDGLSVMDYLEKFAATQLASALPSADGSMRLVSRNWGQLRLRSGLVSGFSVGIQDSERGDRGKIQLSVGFIRSCRVTYNDLLTGNSNTIEVLSAHDGGQVLDEDLSDLVWGACMARACCTAKVSFFGDPQPVLVETWTDCTNGLQGDLAPAFYAEWQIGDLVTLSPVSDAGLPASVTAFKIYDFEPGIEARQVSVALVQLPNPVPSNGSAP